MKNITRTFLTGLVTIVPVVATIYLFLWLVVAVESFLAAAMRSVLPGLPYWPGLGMVLVIVFIFLVGLIMRTWVAQRLFSWAESILNRLPVVRTVYGPLRDFFRFLTEPKQTGLQQVVAVEVGGSNMRLVGFLTREDLSALPEGLRRKDTVAVYLPMSYQVGGYMVFVPRASVQPIDMSFEDAMRLTLTAGLSTKAERT